MVIGTTPAQPRFTTDVRQTSGPPPLTYLGVERPSLETDTETLNEPRATPVK